jgi:signal peptidase II
VAPRWKILIAVGVVVSVLDQWTKFLAVKHLTPGIAQAHFDAQGLSRPTLEERRQTLESLGPLESLGYFYGAVKEPCRAPQAYCPTVRVIDGFWSFRYVENPGAAWGLLAGASKEVRVPFFYVFSIGALVFILWMFHRAEEQQRLLIWALALVFGGAIGNLIDRLHLTYVIDFIDWYVGDKHWPTFNVADSAISVGVGMLVLDMFINKPPKKEAAAKGGSDG